MSDWVGNGNSVYKTLGASNHTDKEREKDDYYATDPIAIDKLLTVERPNENAAYVVRARRAAQRTVCRRRGSRRLAIRKVEFNTQRK